MVLIWCCWIKIILLLLSFPLLATSQTLFQVDFTNATGDPEDWFKKNKWEYQQDMDEAQMAFKNGALHIQTDDSVSGAVTKKLDGDKALKNAKRIRIEWGVELYPKGADWSGPIDKARNTREAIAVMLFFGEDKVDSGKFYIPDLPYFFGIILGENERPGKTYVGNNWQKGGRYFCPSCTGQLGEFTTEFEIESNFIKEFSVAMPPISAITIEVDTKDTKPTNGIHSKAYIKRIEILAD